MQRDRHIKWRAAGMIAISIIAVLVFVEKPKLLLYNHTPSVPVGWYVYAGRTPQRGDLIAVALPSAAHAYAVARGESTAFRLLKPVIAVSGDRVSTLNSELCVNGVSFGPIPVIDTTGRPLPRWQADRVLAAGELLVGSTAEHSFDSRFFGPVHASQVLGVYRPLAIGSTGDTPAEPMPNRTPIHRGMTSSRPSHGG